MALYWSNLPPLTQNPVVQHLCQPSWFDKRIRFLWGLNGEKYRMCSETTSSNSYPASTGFDDILQSISPQAICGEALGKRGRSCRGPSNGSSAPGLLVRTDQIPTTVAVRSRLP